MRGGLPRVPIFVLGTAALAVASRRSLACPRSHGFPRFFGFVVLLAGGALLKRVSWSSASLTLAAAACFVATALAEEPENLRTFGDEYAAYRSGTHMLVPYLLSAVVAGPARRRTAAGAQLSKRKLTSCLPSFTVGGVKDY